MRSIQERAKENFPSILLTVLSIVQALALELLWDRLHESAFLWLGGWAAAIGWSQVGTMLLGFLQIWLYYVSIVLRLRWVPSSWDSVIPFGIGLLEFAMVDLMDPDFLGPWFWILATLFTLSMLTSHDLFRRARADSDNRELYARFEPATAADFAPGIATVVGLVLFGLIFQLTAHREAFALAAVLGAAAALIHQIRVTHYFMSATLHDEFRSDTANDAEEPEG